jgi:hypothetical protein
LNRVGVAMDMIAHTFQTTFTLQWLLFAVPLALLMSLLVNKVTAAAVLSIFAVAIQNFGPLLWPMVMQSAPQQTMMTAVTAAAQKLDPVAIVMELIVFTFFISVFALTRQDMFREKPTT